MSKLPHLAAVGTDRLAYPLPVRVPGGELEELTLLLDVVELESLRVEIVQAVRRQFGPRLHRVPDSRSQRGERGDG